MKPILTFCLLLTCATLFAQIDSRSRVLLNNDWKFTKENPVVGENNQSVKWQAISLPHTWNIEDVMDDSPGYYRGPGWYKKIISSSFFNKSKKQFLFFEGANQQTEVFINGKAAGSHIGGYNGFYIPVVNETANDVEILVKVDNSYNRSIPPLTADFTFYGGLYRDLWLVTTNDIHFSTNDHGSEAVYLSTPTVSEKKASLSVRAIINNASGMIKQVKLSTTVTNQKGKQVGHIHSIVKLNTGEQSIQQSISHIERPHLWSPDDPYLYTASTIITDVANGNVIDKIDNKVGFRYFKFDPGKGFFLNGKSCKLVGASRHQDREGLGNAVPDSLARADVQLLKDMGANFLRVAHYPQDPSVLTACDELGILASVEIPIVNEITESDSFYRNSEQMQIEMIRQNFNHPSVIIWCYMNEVLLKPAFTNDKPRQKIYFSNIKKLAQRLDSLTRIEDPSRYTMMAHHGDLGKYRDAGLVDIPMIVGWNLYSGWYGATLADFPNFLDQFHKAYPLKPMMVTEYGADADPRIHSTTPVRFDKSVEYTTAFHQFYLAEMQKRPFVAAAMIWNLADFNSETRTESMPHINNKGLLQWNRTPKDPYYFYKAMLRNEPFVKIIGPMARAGICDSAGTTCKQQLQVAGNLKHVELLVNGQSYDFADPDNGVASWNVHLKNGINTIEVRAEKAGRIYSDHAELVCSLQPFNLTDNNSFAGLNVLLGANRFFTDSENGIWYPCQDYREGSWGVIGGKPFKMANNNRLPYGTDKNINNSVDDPIYQTQQAGIEKYRIDVPAGEYEISMHFAELLGGTVKELDYNLSGGDRTEPGDRRVFDVFVNGKLTLEKFNIAEQYGVATAVVKTCKVLVTGSEGIELYFRAIEGEPILNALQVRKVADIRSATPSAKE